MKSNNNQDLKKVVRDGLFEALKSSEVRNLIKEGTLAALESTDGQEAIVDALKSQGGQDAIAEALRSTKGKEAFNENFIEVFEDTVMPTLENMSDGIDSLKYDFNILKESAVKRDEFNEALSKKMICNT